MKTDKNENECPAMAILPAQENNFVRIGEFDSPLVFSPLKDITAYELAALVGFIVSGSLTIEQQEKLCSLPKEVLRHISTSDLRLSEVQILSPRKQIRSSLFSRFISFISR